MAKSALEKLMKQDPALYKALLLRQAAELNLHEFVKQAWASIETNPFQDNWHIQVLCTELQKITSGENRFLLINLPPRCMKTLLVNICWPVWTWIQSKKSFTSGNGVRFLCASYGDKLTLDNADKMRDLINSNWFQENWGDRVKLRQDRSLKSSYAIEAGGMRQSTSIVGSLLGLGGDILVADDLHNTESVESDKERESTLRGWREFSSTRLNDPQRSAMVVVMQRLHERDVAGTIISGSDYDKWTHLMFPMRHDPDRHCESDPRIEAGELMWPERFGDKEVSMMERELGPYMSSGRLQQSPSPEGGGIIKRDYWKLWPPEGEEKMPDGELRRNEFPPMEYVIASTDTAYTEKEENDYNALAILGLFHYRGMPKIMLMHAWKKHLEFRGATLPRNPGETEMEWKKRRKLGWGMLEWTAYECHRFEVDKLIIEGRATGITLAQEMRKIYTNERWATQLIQPKGSKMARVVSIQPLFAEGMIFAPDREWAETAISEFESFPKGAHDDLVDAVTHGIAYLRGSGMALRREEARGIERDKIAYRGSKMEPLYDV